MSDSRLSSDSRDLSPQARETYLVRGTVALMLAAGVFLAWTVFSLGKFVMTLGPTASGWALFSTIAPLVGIAALFSLVFYGRSQIKRYRASQTRPMAELSTLRSESAVSEPVAHSETADAA